MTDQILKSRNAHIYGRKFDIDAKHIGVVGWYAGGQLALSLACQSKVRAKRDDPVTARLSHISAVVTCFALLGFLDWDGAGTDDMAIMANNIGARRSWFGKYL